MLPEDIGISFASLGLPDRHAVVTREPFLDCPVTLLHYEKGPHFAAVGVVNR